MARRPKTEQKDSWKEILAKGFVGLCIRLLDRGQLVPFFMLIVTIGVFACMIILAVRIPGGDIGPFLGHLAEFFDSVNPPGWVAVLLPYSVLVNAFLVKTEENYVFQQHQKCLAIANRSITEC